MNKQIVIIGGGFAGVESALRLADHGHDIIIISDDDCFTFVPALYETAAGELHEGDVCILLSDLIKGRNITLYHDRVNRINLDDNYVCSDNVNCIPYDILIICTGAQTNYYGVKGASEYTISLKSRCDAQKIREIIHNASKTKQSFNVVVCGGGLTGVEFASTLSDHIKRISLCCDNDISGFSVRLVQAEPEILPILPAKARMFSLQYLTSQGVVVSCSEPIIEVTNDLIITKKETHNYDLAVWCAGLKPCDLILNSNLPLSGAGGGARGEAGRGIEVNNYLQVKGYPNVFAAGDCIYNDEHPLKTAQNAVHQARLISHNINQLVNGGRLKSYKQINNIFYAAIGEYMGLRVKNGHVSTGKDIKLKKDLLERNYFESLIKGICLEENMYGD